jgi:hypothetical protein
MEDAAVDLWATDEVHVQPHGWCCRMWCHRKPRTPCCCIIRRVAVWDTTPLTEQQIWLMALYPGTLERLDRVAAG